MKVTPDTNERYGAFKVGSQDDLVNALGLPIDADMGSWRRAQVL